MNQIQWYKLRNGKVFHAFETPDGEHSALCGLNAFPRIVVVFLTKVPRRRFCKKCWKKLEELKNE
jgi:hypothetical protein